MTDNFLRTVSSGGDRHSQEAQSENCNAFELLGGGRVPGTWRQRKT